MSDYFNISEGILRGMTYEDASLILRNVNPERHPDVWEQMKKELRKWVQDNIDDMFYELDQHKAEVWADAFPDDKTLTNDPSFPPETLEELADVIQKFLNGNHIWSDTRIYYDGKCLATDNGNGAGESVGDGTYLIRGINPKDYFEYVNPEHIISMSFEGPLYECLNGYAGDFGWDIEEKFSKLLSGYGLYYELGNAWNLSLYKL